MDHPLDQNLVPNPYERLVNYFHMVPLILLSYLYEQDCVRGALKDKTVLLVTHQVDFLHNVDLILVSIILYFINPAKILDICEKYHHYFPQLKCYNKNQVMRDGKVVQSGKYDELLKSGLDFSALVSAHESSMELIDAETSKPSITSPKLTKSPRGSFEHREANGGDKSLERSESIKGTSKLIKDEERETGKVSLNVYKLYCTEAFGWWGVVAVLLSSLLWQATQMSSDYWLAYETSEDRASSFRPSLFIEVYGIIAVISLLVVIVRMFFVTTLGLKTAQIFFKQILNSLLHAPMSFFDTTPSGRILSRVRFLTKLEMLIFQPTWFFCFHGVSVSSIVMLSANNLSNFFYL